MRDHGDYWEFRDGSCFDCNTGNSYNSRDALCNSRLWDSSSSLSDAFESNSSNKNELKRFISRDGINICVDYSKLTKEEREFYVKKFQYNRWVTEEDKKMTLEIEKKLFHVTAKEILFMEDKIPSTKSKVWLYKDEYKDSVYRMADDINETINEIKSFFKSLFK